MVLFLRGPTSYCLSKRCQSTHRLPHIPRLVICLLYIIDIPDKNAGTHPATDAYPVCTCRGTIKNRLILTPTCVMVDGHAMLSQGHDHFLTDMGNYGSPSMDAACCMSLPPSYPIIPLQLWPRFPESTPAPPAPLPIPRYVPIAPVRTTPEAPTPPNAPTSRRTLTNEDRRRICQYHEEHKKAKHTEIGGKFRAYSSTN